MKVYLAGPMRGYPNFNFPAFDFAAAALRSQGHEVFSPAERDREAYGPEVENNPTGDESKGPPGLTIRDCMLADTDWICRHAEAIALLPGWEKSRGALAEKALGEAIGATIIILGQEYVNHG